MTVTLSTPDGLPNTGLYEHVAVATGGRQIYIAGQVAYDSEGQIVALGDLAGQVAQAYRNVAIALRSAGATFQDVVRLTVYVADWGLEKMPEFLAGTEQVREELNLTPAPASLIGVSILFDPRILVEIEATAVVDGASTAQVSG